MKYVGGKHRQAKVIAEHVAQANVSRLYDPSRMYDSTDGHPYRVWRGVQNERRLCEVSERLDKLGIKHEVVVEPDDGAMLKGQMTALATLYYTKEELAPAFAANDTYELRVENCSALKSEAIGYVVKQPQSQSQLK